jgi:polyhydroxybutyrate depolymerase
VTRSRPVLVLAPLLALLAGCPDDKPPMAAGSPALEPSWDVATKAVTVDELSRRFIVSAPHAKGPWPIVLVLHGGGMTGEGMRAYADLERRAQSRALFVYPDAVVRNVWAGEYALHWDGTKDLSFMDAIVRSVVASGQGDPLRVYAFGLSSGAYFANQLACAWGNRLSGFAAVEGGGPFGECSGPVSALIVHDPTDPVVPASEGKESLARWLHEDRCQAPEDAWDVRCKLHACAAGKRVASCSPAVGVHGIGPGARESSLRFFGL